MLSGKYEAARQYLKRVDIQQDLDAQLLWAECFAIEGNSVALCYTYFVDAVVKSDVTISDLLRWFQQVLRKTPDVNGLLRMCGLILLMYAIAKKYEIALCNDRPAYIKKLRDFVLSLDETGFMLILHGGTRRMELRGFVLCIMRKAMDDLRSLSDENDINNAHRGYILALTNFLVEGIVDSKFRTEATIYNLERSVPQPSKFKVYGMLLGWKGILHLATGQCAEAIGALDASIEALQDATDEHTGKDVRMRLHSTRRNLGTALDFRTFMSKFMSE